MRVYVFERESWLPRPVEDVFAFFSDAWNLERVTPARLHFEILTPPPIRMAAGTLIDYRLRLFGVPFQWRTEITVWQPPIRFVDVQRRGPYRQWVHEHRFSGQDGGTRMRDRVDYAIPGRLLAPLIHRLFIRPNLHRIFEYRENAFHRIFRAGQDDLAQYT